MEPRLQKEIMILRLLSFPGCEDLANEQSIRESIYGDGQGRKRPCSLRGSGSASGIRVGYRSLACPLSVSESSGWKD